MDLRFVAVFVFSFALVDYVRSDAVDFGKATPGWSYDGAGGPEKWYENYPDCGGTSQSPIDIETDHVLYDPFLQYFDFSDFHRTQGLTMQLYNMGGHTAEVVYSGPKIRLMGGGLPAEYVVDQFHFHWGGASERGSEHALNGHHYPMEMHIVNHQDRFENSTNAMARPNGLAVIGFFFEIGEHNAEFDHIVRFLPQIAPADQNVEIPTFALFDLLPKGNIDFFRYFGSLTTPPCYESVIWSIATETIKISEAQIAEFRKLRDHENHQLVDDFRPIQGRNHRVVISTAHSKNVTALIKAFLKKFIHPLI